MTTTREGRVRTGRYPDPSGSDTFCRELEVTPAGEVSASGRLSALFRAHLGLPPCLRGADWPKSRFPPPPATGRTIGCTQGAFRSGELLQDAQDSPGEPSQDLCSRRVNLCPQVVPKLWTRGPRIISSYVVRCSDGAVARLGAGC
jgi:hypothetical protein